MTMTRRNVAAMLVAVLAATAVVGFLLARGGDAPTSASILRRAGCQTVTEHAADGDVGNRGADCLLVEGVVVTADAYRSTLDRNEAILYMLDLLGGWEPVTILIGPNWTVWASSTDSSFDPGPTLAAVAARIGGTMVRGVGH